jgi:hypothetical protein
MHAVVSSLMAATLLVHAVLGCCWHSRCDQQQTKGAACCKHHEHCQDQEPAKPCKCRVECHGVCTYLPTQKVQVDTPEVVVPFDFVATLSFAVGADLASALREAVYLPDDIEPPLRLHLAHQVLLI